MKGHTTFKLSCAGTGMLNRLASANVQNIHGAFLLYQPTQCENAGAILVLDPHLLLTNEESGFKSI